MTAGVDSLLRSVDLHAGLERRFGMLADWLLTQKGLVIDPSTRLRLMRLVAHATDTGSRRIKDNIELDYGDDHRLAQYPVFKNSKHDSSSYDWDNEAIL